MLTEFPLVLTLTLGVVSVKVGNKRRNALNFLLCCIVTILSPYTLKSSLLCEQESHLELCGKVIFVNC